MAPKPVPQRLDELEAAVLKDRTLLESTARLSLQTAHRVQSAATQRSLIAFFKGDCQKDY